MLESPPFPAYIDFLSHFKMPEICIVNTVAVHTLLFLGTLNNKQPVTKLQCMLDARKKCHFIIPIRDLLTSKK